LWEFIIAHMMKLQSKLEFVYLNSIIDIFATLGVQKVYFEAI